jgi:hypothetical protein
MVRLSLESEDWVPTILLELIIANSQETLRRQLSRQYQTFRKSNDFVTQPLAQQNLQGDRAILQPTLSNQ